MAVEAHHLRVFPPQQQHLVRNRDTMKAVQNHHLSTAAPMVCVAPTTTVVVGNFNPIYNAAGSESRITFNDVLSPPTRKRQRGVLFLGEDVSPQLLQQQFEIDRIVCQHMERMKSEVDERRKRFSKQILATVEEGIRTRLLAKEEEIERIGKLNFALEDRIRTLAAENQIWRELAQTNQAAVNVLRSNLEQVLAAQPMRSGDAAIGDAESFCGGCQDDPQDDGAAAMEKRICRQCGKREPAVLILPCRHLCICMACSPEIEFCPVCKSCKNGSVLVNMS